MEFFDHTYQEHFGCPLPTYLPRAMVLEYLLARCTKDYPDLFRDVNFNTSVESVKHDAASGKFLVKLSDGTEDSFDICIWAAGNNGKPKIPPAIDAVFTKGRFKGVTMHSSQTDANFDAHVRDKRVLIIGDGYSAEDLTLQAIKLGAKGIDIVSRSGRGAASYTASWPGKVSIHQQYTPAGVTGDGHGIVLSKTDYDDATEEYVVDPDPARQTTLDGVHTFIYCTGYAPNTHMLAEDLQPADDPQYPGYCRFAKEDFPAAWRMAPHPLSAAEGGDVPLGDVYLPAPCSFVHPDLYRGRLVRTPTMFFLRERDYTPLVEIDVFAWRALAQIVGDLPLPTLADVRRHNVGTLLGALDDPAFRAKTDDSVSLLCLLANVRYIDAGGGLRCLLRVVPLQTASSHWADALPDINIRTLLYCAC